MDYKILRHVKRRLVSQINETPIVSIHNNKYEFDQLSFKRRLFGTSLNVKSLILAIVAFTGATTSASATNLQEGCVLSSGETIR